MRDMSDWPKWPEMNWLRLLEGPSDRLILPIAPTMPHLIYRGEKYFRMPDARGSRRPGGRGHWTARGGLYLWDGWWAVMLQKAREAESTPSATLRPPAVPGSLPSPESPAPT